MNPVLEGILGGLAIGVDQLADEYVERRKQAKTKAEREGLYREYYDAMVAAGATPEEARRELAAFKLKPDSTPGSSTKEFEAAGEYKAKADMQKYLMSIKQTPVSQAPATYGEHNEFAEGTKASASALESTSHANLYNTQARDIETMQPSEIGKNMASAEASRASADASTASAEKSRADVENDERVSSVVDVKTYRAMINEEIERLAKARGLMTAGNLATGAKPEIDWSKLMAEKTGADGQTTNLYEELSDQAEAIVNRILDKHAERFREPDWSHLRNKAQYEKAASAGVGGSSGRGSGLPGPPMDPIASRINNDTNYHPEDEDPFYGLSGEDASIAKGLQERLESGISPEDIDIRALIAENPGHDWGAILSALGLDK